jgi:monovalent cation:proton antiporter-2 (CPA2) family protein
VEAHLSLFFILFVVLLATKLASHLSVRLGQPAVLGKLLIGVIVGPAVLGWVQGGLVIDEIAQIGVLLLMFIAGMETDLKLLKQNMTASLLVALGGIVLPLLGGYGVGALLGMSEANSWFIGLLLSATSVSISVQVMKEMNKLGSREGTTILGAAVFDDIIVVVLLAFFMSFVGTGTASGIDILIVIGKKLLFFAAAILLGWKAVPWIMRIFSPLRATEAVISAGLIICFGFSYLAELLGIAGMIGAFAAGIAVAQTSHGKTVEHRIEPIAYGIFVPIFFVSIGISVSLDGLSEHIGLIVILTVVAVATKLLGSGFGARISRFGWRSSLAVGAGMISRGEVALIIADIGLKEGLLPSELFSAVVLVVLLTTIASPPLLKLWLADRREGTVRQ